jgi:uncharacterized protein (DUF697 family)
MLRRVGGLAEFWRVVGEINPEGVREEAEQPVHVVVMGERDAGKRSLRRTLLQDAPIVFEVTPAGDVVPAGPPPPLRHPASVPAPGSPGAIGIVELPPGLTSLDELPGGPPRGNVVLYVIDLSKGVTHQQAHLAHQVEARGLPVLIVLTKSDVLPDDPDPRWSAERILGGYASIGLVLVDPRDARSVEQHVVPALLRALPNLSIALGRSVPLFRQRVAAQVIAETARVNAEFALLSSLPTNIPVIGTVIGGGADLLVLTKNQAMMLYRLAAVFGRSLESRATIAAEIAPVVGAAFFWRTVSRTLVGLLPGLVASVPKTMVAYAGTYTVGRMAQYYYASGRRPPEAVLVSFRREAARLAKRFVPRPRQRAEPPAELTAAERPLLTDSARQPTPTAAEGAAGQRRPD